LTRVTTSLVISIKKAKRIKVNCLYLESNEEAFVMYEWQADETGENLTKERILDAMKNADKRNQEREDFFNSLLTPEINITKELYEMVEDFLHEETKPIDYLHDEIKLTEQDRQVAAQILEDIFCNLKRSSHVISNICVLHCMLSPNQSIIQKRKVELFLMELSELLRAYGRAKRNIKYSLTKSREGASGQMAEQKET